MQKSEPSEEELTHHDKAKIESLDYTEKLEPVYDEWIDSLVWQDEVPDDLSREGTEILYTLIRARSFLHDTKKKTNLEKLVGSVQPTLDVWEKHLLSGLRWPGFNRVALTLSQRDYLHREKALALDVEKRLKQF